MGSAESFDLSDILGKYVSKPSEATKPEFIVLYGRPGCGKGLIYGTPVITPTGPVNVENLVVGDYAIGSDGTPTRVYGIWDRGELPVYEVTLSDGATITVDGEHLWTGTTAKGTLTTIPTSEVMARLESTHPKFLTIPTVKPVLYEEVYLPIDPYLLGALIADGYLSGTSVQWTKNDANVVLAVDHSANLDGYWLVETTRESSTARQWKINHAADRQNYSVIKRAIEALALDVKSVEKFIPERYLTSSVNDRWRLVRGLFDGDGSVRADRSSAMYHTSSRRLRDDVLQLLWSLGVSAHSGQQPKADGTWWINVLSDHEMFYASEHVGRNTMVSGQAHRRIVSVVPVGTAQVRCIAVEAADQLYVTKDYIVTHNTWLAASASELPGVRKTLILDVEGSTVGTLADFDDDKIDIIRVSSFEMLEAIFDKLFDVNAVHEYDVVIIDTLDVAQEWAIKHFKSIAPMGSSGSPDGFWTWGQVSEWTTKRLGTELRKAKFLAIAVVHEKEDKGTDGGLVKGLKLQGSAKDTWPGLPDVVAYLTRSFMDDKVKTLAYFDTEDNMVTKNRFKFPAKVLEPTIPGLFKFIETRNAEKSKAKETK